MQASLLDAVGRHLATLPREVVTEALAVVTAVDRLTAYRRTTADLEVLAALLARREALAAARPPRGPAPDLPPRLHVVE